MARAFRPPRCVAFVDEGQARICGTEMRALGERDPRVGPHGQPGHWVFLCPRCGALRAVTKQALGRYLPATGRLTVGDILAEVPCPHCRQHVLSVLKSRQAAVLCERCLSAYYVRSEGRLEPVDLSRIPMERAEDIPSMARPV